MFAVGPLDVIDRRVLIVEDNEAVSALLVEFVLSPGGTVVGPFACPRKAIRAVSLNAGVDAAMVATDLINDMAIPLVRQLERHGLLILWVVGHDGWFVGTEEDEEAAVYRLDGDPQNVVRFSRGSF